MFSAGQSTEKGYEYFLKIVFENINHFQAIQKVWF